MEKSVSIIIPTLNESQTIENALHAARALEGLEIIVSDGGSVDDTVARARQFAQRHDGDVIVIHSPLGRGRQLAAGARIARGDVLLFLHADNQLPAHAISQIAQASWPVWGGFRQRIDHPSWRFRILEIGNALRAIVFGRVFGDQALYVHRSRYNEVGGFAEVELMEDVLLSSQLFRHHRPRLLAGPVTVDPRRWLRRGVVRQTWLNWQLQYAFARGATPEELRKRYG
ncbi:TIGR04283 family arsenosugar biosynthesis glycosyltransferase [Allorhodopirellula heiligendammensis]|uniref:PGL/p-HBAD biosynthesis glycosyltransferase n=1 Tax=Allorhodopirellula heiligendammensis TaxID=2714739 RepID=A0A5C6C2K9_9BACT|nr:TIGR04283 family arsenosugar biosynthesis glycosyltransferase [Allorhodopirellula heiligendammensis]TWU18368.1 PGL/p-HBAD biosynthesis glycosyltransferase [Allorhodopirellula heiligendammensis]